MTSKFISNTRIHTEPVDTIVYRHENNAAVQLLCGARQENDDGNNLLSQPVQWYGESRARPLSATADNANTILTDTRLLFTNTITGDKLQAYHCVAAGGDGRVVERSRQVRVDIAFINNFASSRLDVYATHGLGKSLPCAAPEHFPTALSYAWTYDNVKQYVKQTRRIFTSRDGTLYFAYLIDEDDAHNYSCSVANNQLQAGQFGPFFALRLTKQPGVADTFPPTIAEDFIKQHPRRAIRGTSVVLECFAYARPAADYTWRRIDEVTGMPVGEPIKDAITNGGRQLVVTVAGVYECAAENILGVARARRTVDLFDPPRVTHRPTDIHTSINAVANLYCPIWAHPPPIFEWYHNARPLSPLLMTTVDQERIQIRGESLRISQLTSTDTGAYTCVGRNEFGSVATSIHVYINSLPPSFSALGAQPHLLRVHVHAGDRARLACPVTAAPAASVLWRRNGRIVDMRGRYSPGNARPDNNILQIVPVIADDAGEYTCLTANVLGTSVLRIELIVYGRRGVGVSWNNHVT
jgi:hypothetical protein